MIRGVFILSLGFGLGYAAALEHREQVTEKLQTLTEALEKDIALRRADATTEGEPS
jgi:uncharacterized protein YjiS (DUF1127 family)